MELYLECRFRLPLVVPDVAGSSGADFADLTEEGGRKNAVKMLLAHAPQHYDKALLPFIENLQSATGDIECRPAIRLAERLKNNKDEAGTGNMLSKWKTRSYIEALPNGRFKKLPQKHDK